MLRGPTTLSAEHERRLNAHAEEFQFRLLDAVERLLDDVAPPELEDRLYRTAFERNRTLPKREVRPKRETAYLAEQIFLCHDRDDATLATVLEFAVAVTEYYDITDDLIDGDVADGHERDVIVTLQILLALFVGRLGSLGDDVTTYWSRRALDLTVAPFRETTTEPSLTTYVDLVETQSTFFGFVCGVSALAADAGCEAVERAERIGKVYYVYEQYVVDLRQYLSAEPETWNLWTIADESKALDIVEDQRSAVTELLRDVPSSRADKIRALFAHDVAALLDAGDE